MHSSEIGHGDDDHNGPSYKIHITKMGTQLRRTVIDKKQTLISGEQVIGDQTAKGNKQSQ